LDYFLVLFGLVSIVAEEKKDKTANLLNDILKIHNISTVFTTSSYLKKDKLYGILFSP